MKNLVIAMDGPAGAGKSTVAQLVAKKLQYTYIDTGAMYRAVAWKTLQRKAPVTDELICEVVRDITVDLQYADGRTRVFADGQEITKEIDSRVTASISHVAPLAPSPENWELRRQMAGRGSVVMMEGYCHPVRPNAGYQDLPYRIHRGTADAGEEIRKRLDVV